MNRYVSLILFLVLVLGGGLALGVLTVPGAWYTGLAKPTFNPPGWWQDHVAAWLFVPYAAWVAFALVLNGSIWALN